MTAYVYDPRAQIAHDLRAAGRCYVAGAISLGRAYEAHAKHEREQLHRTLDRMAAARLAAMQAPPAWSRLGPHTHPMPLLAFDATDGAIRATAARCAALCAEAVELSREDMEALARARNVCHAQGVAPPELKEDGSNLVPCLRRMACSRWWRRRLRTLVARRVEARAIAAGEVRKGRAAYCSEPGLVRRRAAAQRNHELLQLMQAVNELGDTFSLAELAELSTSNPELRRNELMTRVKGCEALAHARGDVGLFVTTTLPSRFHGVSPRYDGSSPKAGQAYLCEGWAQSRAVLAKDAIRLYGMRVAEPHADGTPHAHALIFCPPQHVERVIAELQARALRDDAGEPGAAEHRFTVEEIDSAKGSAVAYVSKYLAKNVDGFQLKFHLSRKGDGDGWEISDSNPQTAAERIKTWASTWGIRQFQFFGLPPVSWWRELRRLASPSAWPVIEAARLPADAGDYAAHVAEVGGVCRPRAEMALATWRETDSRETRYGDPRTTLYGIQEADGPGRELTRPHRWELVIAQPSLPAPWTRVNNCNRPGQPGGDVPLVPPGLVGADCRPVHLQDYFLPHTRRNFTRGKPEYRRMRLSDL